LRRRAARLACWIALGAVLLYAAYLAALNGLVQTRLLRHLFNGDPRALLLEYDRASSWIPGRIRVDGLRLRGRDSNVEWILRIDRCDFTVSFGELVRRRFHASNVRGDGLSLRVRQRRPSFTEREVASLPPVPGFSDPPYAGPPSPPLRDEDYNLWSIRLDGVEARHVREVWIDTLRYSGDLDIRGRWFFRPVRWLEIGPAVVEARELTMSRGLHEEWARLPGSRLAVTVHPYDVRGPKGAQLLDQFSVAADLRGTLLPAASLRHLLRGTGVEVRRAEWPLEAHVEVDRGVVRDDTDVKLGSSTTLAAVGDTQLGCASSVEAAVRGGVGRVRAECDGLAITRGGATQVGASRAEVTLSSRQLDLAHPFEDARASASATAIAVPSLPGLVDWIAPGTSVVEGGDLFGAARIDVDLARESGTGWVRGTGRDVRLRIGSRRFAGTLGVHLQARQEGAVTDLAGTGVTFTDAGLPDTTSWSGAVELVRAELRMREREGDGSPGSSPGPRLEASVAARATDASPLAAAVAAESSVPLWLLNLISTKDFAASGDLSVAPHRLVARSVRAQGRGVGLGFELANLPDDRQWALYVSTGLLSVGIDSSNGKTGVQLLGAGSWFERKTASLRALERRHP
jgi:hypothetical protein